MLLKIFHILVVVVMGVMLFGVCATFLLIACSQGIMVGRTQAWQHFLELDTPQNKVFEAVYPARRKVDDGEPRRTGPRYRGHTNEIRDPDRDLSQA